MVNPFSPKEEGEENRAEKDIQKEDELEEERALIELLSQKEDDVQDEEKRSEKDEDNEVFEATMAVLDLAGECTLSLTEQFAEEKPISEEDSQQDVFEDNPSTNLEGWEKKIIGQNGTTEVCEKELNQKITDQESVVMESKHSVEEMERQFIQIEELTKDCLVNLSQEEKEQLLSQENKEDDENKMTLSEQKHDDGKDEEGNKEEEKDVTLSQDASLQQDVTLSQDASLQQAMRAAREDSSDEDCLEIMTQAELEAQGTIYHLPIPSRT